MGAIYIAATSTTTVCIPIAGGIVGCEVGTAAGVACCGRPEYGALGGAVGSVTGAGLAADCIYDDIEDEESKKNNEKLRDRI